MRRYRFPGSSGLGATIEFSNRWLHFTIFEGIILQPVSRGRRRRFVSLWRLKGTAETPKMPVQAVLKQQPQDSQLLSNLQHRHH